MPEQTALVRRVEAWIADDPNPRDRAELQALLDAGRYDELALRFAGPPEFGTAGLRAPVGAGESRMNVAVVRRATAGLAAYLGSLGGRSAVVGRDARHRSDQFATDAAAVLAGAGIATTLLPGPLPTPVLAFAVRHLRADAGVMVTASHNPPADNGYKVYLGDGVQIVPPADADIAAAMGAVGLVGSLRTGQPAQADDAIVQAYVDAVAALAPAPDVPPMRVVSTAMHGVAAGTLTRAVSAAGFAALDPVAAQAEPDPDFPTLAFPNPEEPGALDLALAQARATGAALVVATDPDGDRMDAAVPDARSPGGWRILRGDELGVLLGDDVLRRGRGAERVVAASVVSSSMLARVAASYGVNFRETLTGFKWIARAADEVPGGRFAFGYEEALGFCIGDVVRDKDGISATLSVLRLAQELAAAGQTLLDRLDALYVEHGVHLTAPVTLRVDGPQALPRIAAAVDAVRRDPPARLGGQVVTDVVDLRDSPAGLPPTDAVILRLGSGGKVVVRPSGTEPKLKAYLEIVTPVTGKRSTGLDAAKAAARADLDALAVATGALLRVPDVR